MNIKSLLRSLLAATCSAAAFLTVPDASAQIINTSVRVRVGTGDDILVTGFVIGNTPKTLLFRAVGPGLAAFGVSGTLADPTMTVYTGANLVKTNNDWGVGPDASSIVQTSASVGAFALPNGSKDSALIATLQPGGYTVHISGADGGTGIALFEAYEITTTTPPPPPASGNGTLRGVVRDGVSGNGVSGVSLTFTSSTGASLGSVTTSSTGEYSITLPAGTVSATLSASGYVATTLSATVVANTTTQADPVLFAQSAAGTGTITGRITNALTGAGVPGASLQLRSGANITTGSVIATATTDSSGNYTTTAASGTYTAQVSLTGFVTTDFVCVSVGGRTIGNQNASITPVLSGTDMRVVLTWGASPSDLDSHFTGPTTGTSRFHVYYSTKAPTGAGASLDVDDQSQYGPETVTITQTAAGVYRYSVHDYSNRSSTSSTALSTSGAQVKVYQGSTLVATFNVPTGQTGTLWTVFEMDGTTKTITPKNTMTNHSDASTVPYLQEGAVQVLPENDGELLGRLPPKK